MIKVEYNRPDLKKLDELGTEALNSESTMNLVANGATLMSVNKDTLRGIIRILLERMRWIPCSEKMPEDCLSERETPTRVQIRCILSSGKRVFFGSRTRYGTYKKWFWNRGSNITHWMPLPQPPKEEQ